MNSQPENIGTILKEQRQKLGYSLQEVAERTRIRRSHLEDLESNNLDNLPGRAYVTGFITIYARFLGLDEKDLLASDQVSGVPKPSLTGKTPLPQKYDKQFYELQVVDRRRKVILAGLFFVAVILMVFFYFGARDNATVENSPQVTSPPPEKAVVEKQTAEPEVVNQDESVPPVAEEIVSVEQAAPVQVEKTPWPAISQAGSSLRMLALSEGSLIIVVDKRKPVTYSLSEGLDLTWKAKSQISIEISPVNVADFWLDGQQLDVTDVRNIRLEKKVEE